MKAAGYEHRKFECIGCQRTERRLAFSGDSASLPFEYRWALASLFAAKPSSVAPGASWPHPIKWAYVLGHVPDLVRSHETHTATGARPTTAAHCHSKGRGLSARRR
jgi:hypothetical protein